MTAKFFVDTNVLVYAYDSAELDKQARAIEIIDHLARTASGAISTQVLSEFFVTVVHKRPARMSLEQAYARLKYYAAHWTVIGVTSAVILEAVRGVQDYQINFWDAQIWAAAKMDNITTILSEDFNTGSIIEGVTFVNPFFKGFQMAEVLG
jgi:predicted nucleic acid-binding protein